MQLLQVPTTKSSTSLRELNFQKISLRDRVLFQTFIS